MEEAIKELLSGQRSTIHLKNLVKEEDDSYDNFQKAGDLIENIAKSFSNAMELLYPTSDSRSENNGNSNDSSSPVKKTRRGSYKRERKETISTIVPSTFHDGHSWRKYGQKEILNCKFPRSYFRCSRKYSEGCKAIKHVQMMDDRPHMCEATYIGQHTCKEIQQIPVIISKDHGKRMKMVDPMMGNEGSTDELLGLDLARDCKEVLPLVCSQAGLHDLDADMIEILKMNCGFCF